MLQEKISSRLRFLHYLKEVNFFFHLPKIGAPMSWNAGYIADKNTKNYCIASEILDQEN